MRVVNNSIPREDRAVVQMHLGAINAVLPSPDITQMDVEVGPDHTYTLVEAAKVRFSAKMAWLSSHQLPSMTGTKLPSIAPTVQAAAKYFSVPLPAAPTGSLDVDDAGIPRP